MRKNLVSDASTALLLTIVALHFFSPHLKYGDSVAWILVPFTLTWATSMCVLMLRSLYADFYLGIERIIELVQKKQAAADDKDKDKK